MIVEKVIIKGFKCFKEATEISLNDMTCFIGTNGTGKSAAMEALCRLFGSTESLRRIKKDDFYVESGTRLEDESERNFYIKAKLCFPELENDGNTDAIPLTFNQMIINSAGESPFCLIRLDATWTKGNTTEGNIDWEINWLNEDVDEPTDKQKYKFLGADKNLIRFYYIPAVRNPENQIKFIAGSTIKQLFEAINWNDIIKNNIEDFSSNLLLQFQNEEGIKVIQSELQKYWSKYMNSGGKYQNVMLSPIGNDLSDILNNVDAYFSPGESGGTDSTEKLSDGTKSLFYLSLLNTMFEIERKYRNDTKIFDSSKFAKPALILFGLEEPENHLAPHYLGRILQVFNELNQKGAQTIISSHSASIVKRISPTNIRYFLQKDNYTFVKSILLPKEKDIAYKYVKEAIQSYPELYFSKLVVFGEGDSEELVIPKIAKIKGIDLDSSFVSFVPLGGRFVNHYWRLLENLEIPYITLLDYDQGRHTGGEEKLKYVFDQLLEKGKITEKQIGIIKTLPNEEIRLRLENDYNVFFSFPIDLDYLMLENFFEEYTDLTKHPESKGPDIPSKEDVKFIEKNKIAIASVLKKDSTDVNGSEIPIDLAYWYRYLFLGKGKPISHMNGISLLDKEKLEKSPVLCSFFNAIKEHVIHE